MKCTVNDNRRSRHPAAASCSRTDSLNGLHWRLQNRARILSASPCPRPLVCDFKTGEK